MEAHSKVCRILRLTSILCAHLAACAHHGDLHHCQRGSLLSSANWNGRSWHYSAKEVCRGGSACQHSADLRLTVQDGAQGNAVRLETANAALLQKLGNSWQEALAEEHAWDLVEVLIPESQLQH